MMFAMKYIQANIPNHLAKHTDRGWETWVDETYTDTIYPLQAKLYFDLNEAYVRRHQFDGFTFMSDKYHTVEEFAS